MTDGLSNAYTLRAELVKEKEMEREDFRKALHQLLDDAGRKGETAVTVRSGDLHRLVGGYPGPDHRMPVCCSVMREEMREGDRIVEAPPQGDGANLFIEYQLPR